MSATTGSLPGAPRPGEGYIAGLALTIPIVPGIAAVATVLAYLLLPSDTATFAANAGSTPTQPEAAILIGLLVTALSWVLLGAVARPLTSAENAQPRFYRELRGRHRLLDDRLKGANPPAGPQSAAQEIDDLLRAVDIELNGAGSAPALRWALAYGYTNVLRELHRAAEILILIEPADAVVGDALDDDLSLEDSTITGRDRLRTILRAATSVVSPPAASTFLPAAAGTTTSPAQALGPAQAREAIREVHHAVKSFRDDRRDELVRARNNLVWTMLALATPAYLLLGLALVRGVSRIEVATAATFYLVGAVIGLFQRLNNESKRDTAVEDFGLYQARLFTAPVLSGLAAVAGVYLMAVAPSLIAVDGSQAAAASPTDVFNLVKNQIGLVYAAVFGLSPGLLTSRLDQQAKKLSQDLSASAPAAAGTP